MSLIWESLTFVVAGVAVGMCMFCLLIGCLVLCEDYSHRRHRTRESSPHTNVLLDFDYYVFSSSNEPRGLVGFLPPPKSPLLLGEEQGV
ncbi:hypothetical protein BASA81_005411 [Batrachochytrium salamandrivorans]|nr:hypothetical protein BASA81_005411 [Batrachochytrium salamandrivorans]